MKRFLLSIVAALSGLLLGVVVALWVRSMHVGEAVEREVMYTCGMWAASSRGVCTVAFWRLNALPPEWRLPEPKAEWRYERCTPPPAGSEMHAEHTKPIYDVWGLEYRSGAVVKDHVHQLLIPYWMMAAPLAAIAVVTGVRAARLWRRRRPGLCHRCGYDLRATPERCPECGIAHQV